MPVNRFSPPGDTPPSAAFTQISQVFDDNNPIASFPVSSLAFLQVAAGAVQRCAPRAAGMNVVVPAASGANFNQTITLFMENALGALRVRAASGTIDGALSISLGAGITTCLVLRSNGFSGWVSQRNAGRQLFTTEQVVSATVAVDVTLDPGTDRLTFSGASPTINSISGGSEIGRLVLVYFSGTGVARFKNSNSGPTGNESRMFNPDNTDGLLTTRGSFILQGNGAAGWRTLDWTANTGGNSSLLTLTGITGNQGTIDISGLACGGSVFISAPTGDWQIEGFSGNTSDGFWFHVLTGNSAFIGTIFDEDATPTAGNRIRCQNALDVVGTRIQALFHYFGGGANRWSCVSAPSSAVSGRLLRRTLLTTGTAATFNHLAGAVTCKVTGVGGGGAGGGNNNAAGSVGAQGGSATYGERTFTIAAATSTYTVGAAGVGVSGANGGNGTNSTWLHNATTTTLPAGSGGAFLTSGGTVARVAGGAGGGAATNADLSVIGTLGGDAVRPMALTIPLLQTSPAGSTPLGIGGRANYIATVAAVNGVVGTGFGSGGSGAINGTTTAAAGANGAPGLWIVEEYS